MHHHHDHGMKLGQTKKGKNVVLLHHSAYIVSRLMPLWIWNPDWSYSWVTNVVVLLIINKIKNFSFQLDMDDFETIVPESEYGNSSYIESPPPAAFKGLKK
jgi:hypothetical protein